MSEQAWWYISRASGMVAWGLITLAVLWGLTLSTKVLGKRNVPAWLLDLHRFLGGLSIVFTAIHLGGLAADSYLYFGWAEVFVPMASEWQPGAVAWGVVALYLLLAIEITSLLMRRLPRRLWRAIHQLSFVLYGLATIHGVTAGTDATNGIYVWLSVASVQFVLFLTLIRVVAARRAKRRPAVTKSSSTPTKQPLAPASS